MAGFISMLYKLFLFRSAAIFLGILFAIVIVEILARFFYQEPWYEKLEKGQRRSEKYQYTRNEDGLRDMDYPLRKPSRGRRVLILGDSFTFGLGVPNDEDTFPAILEITMNKQMVHSSINRIEVLNGGISGSLPSNWLRVYKKVSAKFDPDIVLIVFFLRDGTYLKVRKEFLKPILDEITRKNHLSFYYECFFTYRLLKDLLDRSKISTRYTDSLKNAYIGDTKQTRAWHLIQEHVLAIKSLAEKNSVEVGFVIFPILVGLNKNYPFMEICKHLEEFALSNGFQVHNLLPSFMGNYGPNLWVSSYDQHPNEKAHRIAAESMLPFVKNLLIVHEKKDDDYDNIPNPADNCPNTANPRQEDNDGDEHGNACDNCPNDYNPDQVNTDEDEQGDVCDNCYYVFNPNQHDSNGDGIGDACASFELANIWLEAEDADTVVNPLEITYDANASNGGFIYSRNGTGNEYTPGGTIMATYKVNISKRGAYILWGRVQANHGRDNSFFVQIDENLDNMWEVETGDQWHWDKVNDYEILDPVTFILTSGVHTIKVKLREDGTKLDKMLLTNDANFVPHGKGIFAE